MTGPEDTAGVGSKAPSMAEAGQMPFDPLAPPAEAGAPVWRAALKTRLPPELWSVLPSVLRQEGARWGYVLRVATAAFMALGISMVLQLQQPSTAMISALVVMQPQSGAVLAKSIYRALGNLTGGVVAVLLFVLFAQQPVFLLGGIALWVGFCTAGSARQRNAQSYGFVLAGYTACMIALPELASPEHIFATATLRISEVFIGILSAAVTTEVIFPNTVQSVLYSAAKNRFATFDDFVRAALSGGVPRDDVEKMQMNFIRDVATLDSYGASAVFEAGGASHNLRVRLFNTGFMTVSSSFHSLYGFVLRLPTAPDDPIRLFFKDLLNRAVAAMAPEGKSAGTAAEVEKAAAALQECKDEIAELLAVFTASGEIFPEERRLLESGTHLLYRFINDMRAYLLEYSRLGKQEIHAGRARPRFTPGIDKGIALVSGVRATLVLVIALLFWWGTDWPDGSSAAIFAVIFCGLQAAAPNPVRSIFMSTMGCTLGAVMGVLYSFLVLPNMSEFGPMCAALLPFLVIGPYITTVPKVAGVGRGYNFMFASFANPGLALSINPITLVGGAFAKLAGIMLAGAILATFLPAGGRWWKNRLYRGLMREAARSCKGNPDKLIPYFESGVRDILLQFITSSMPTGREKQAMLRRAMAVSNLGRIIIEIRRNMTSSYFLPAEKEMLRPLLAELSNLLARPDFKSYRALLAKIQNAAQKMERYTAPAQASPQSEEGAHASHSKSSHGFYPEGAAVLTRILQHSLMHVGEEMRMLGRHAAEHGDRYGIKNKVTRTR